MNINVIDVICFILLQIILRVDGRQNYGKTTNDINFLW